MTAGSGDGGTALQSLLQALQENLNEQLLILETQARRDQDTSMTEEAVQQIEREIADLRIRIRGQS